MKICLFTNQELEKSPLPENDWPCDPRPFYNKAEWHVETLQKKTAVAQVEKMVEKGFDLYFNLCDGALDEEDNPGVEVVETLEKLGVPFTGADSQFFEPSREKMKDVCLNHGIKTPAYAFVESLRVLPEVLDKLSFPMIVKHYSSYASIDLTKKSVVYNEDELRKQIKRTCRKHGRALVEEFIEGSECTVLVAEAPGGKTVSYTPIEYCFPEGESFKHESIKWKDFDKVDAFPVTDKRLSRKLGFLARKFFKAIGGVSYGRCDFRVDKKGEPYLLEINPNCGLYYPESAAASADLCLLAEKNGHKKFTKQLIECSFEKVH